MSKRKWKERRGYFIVNGKSKKGGGRTETKRQAILEKNREKLQDVRRETEKEVREGPETGKL